MNKLIYAIGIAVATSLAAANHTTETETTNTQEIAEKVVDTTTPIEQPDTLAIKIK